MFKHVLMWRFVDEASPEQKKILYEQFYIMAAEIPEILSFACGPNALSDDPKEPERRDFGAVMDFADEHAWRRYLAHPSHERLANEFLIPIRKDGIQIQFIDRFGSSPH